MANEIQFKFGSFTLDDSSTYLVDGISIDEKKQTTLHKIPNADGSIAEEAKRESISIQVSGSISNTNYDALRTSLDSLKAALQAGFQYFTTDDDRQIKAQYDTFGYDYVKMRMMIKWKATFIAHFPFWLSQTLNTDTRTPTSGVGYTIANAGNAPARVKVEITAPAGGITDNIQVENTTTGKTCRYRGNVSAADVVVINNRVDTDDFEVTNDGVSDFANFEGDFLTLDPGNNTIEFTGTASSSVKLSWRDCWY